MRAAGVISEAELPGKVSEMLGDVTADEVLAVLAEMRHGEPEIEYHVYVERALADEIAALVVARDQPFACDLMESVAEYLQLVGDEARESDHGSAIRGRVRRLRDLHDALARVVWPG